MDNDEKPKEKKKLDKFNAIILVILIVVAGFMFLGGDVEDITDYFNPPEPEIDATVEMYRFIDLSSDTAITVELWIMNSGEKTATEIHVFVRSYNQDGDILHSDNVSMLAMILRGNETTSGLFVLPITSEDVVVHHTVEITWNSSRNIYSETTIL